jgi:hypothetical protein
MWRCVDLVRTDVSVESTFSISRIKKSASHLLTLVPRSLIFFALEMEAILSSETSVHTRYTRLHIPEDCVLYSRRREHLKSYVKIKSLGNVSRVALWFCQEMLLQLKL